MPRSGTGKLIWEWGDSSSRESHGEGAADTPCLAPGIRYSKSQSLCVAGKIWVDSQGTKSHCGASAVSQSGADPKLRAETHRNRPQGVEGALKRQLSFSSLLHPGELGPGLRRSWTPASQNHHFPSDPSWGWREEVSVLGSPAAGMGVGGTWGPGLLEG